MLMAAVSASRRATASRLIITATSTAETITFRSSYHHAISSRQQISAFHHSPTPISRRNATTMTTTSTAPQRDADVVIVGSGLAGMCAAIAAKEHGASTVVVLERSHGGGASALSGGVVYSGGGTAQQKAAGVVSDTPAEMFAYLRAAEVGDSGVVDDATLRRFCEGSADRLRWLESLGARFEGSLCPYKTSYPTDRHYLYYSGSEKAGRFRDVARPAPRGHRMVAKGISAGGALWRAVFRSAVEKGVRFEPGTMVEEVLLGEEGEEDGSGSNSRRRVVGVRYRQLMSPENSESNSASNRAFAKHKKLSQRALTYRLFSRPIADWYDGRAAAIFNRHAVPGTLRSGAVILAAGGYGMNDAMTAAHIPDGIFAKVAPLGTVGDDGSGINLGLAAGGSTSHMDRFSAWRFMYAPDGMLHGVAVDRVGRRIASEDLYGAAFAEAMALRHGGEGVVVLDAEQWRRARGQIGRQTAMPLKAQAWWISLVGRKRSGTLEGLAGKLGVDAVGLRESVEAHNMAIAEGRGDPVGKTDEYRSPVVKPPFYGVDVSLRPAGITACPAMTLGGLRVDGATGLVRREGDDGGVVEGLYAAGRNAVGVCSNGYVSGLSLADCVFSGKRAGEHAASSVVARPL